MTITRESLNQAATHGQPLDHLTAGQVWAAHKLAMPPERLEKPLAPHIALLLQEAADKASRSFHLVYPNSAAMISAAYDDRHPMFLRRPVQEVISASLSETFPGLRPTGVNEDGTEFYSLAGLAKALRTSEEALLELAMGQAIEEEIGDDSDLRLH